LCVIEKFREGGGHGPLGAVAPKRKNKETKFNSYLADPPQISVIINVASFKDFSSCLGFILISY